MADPQRRHSLVDDRRLRCDARFFFDVAGNAPASTSNNHARPLSIIATLGTAAFMRKRGSCSGAGKTTTSKHGLALSHMPTSAHSNAEPQMPDDDTSVVADLIQQSAEGNAALMRGDMKRYNELITLSDDFLLMSPFGGSPTHASDYTPERMEAMGRFFRNGTFEQEIVRAYASSADTVVLATIERANVEVGGLPAQDWALRVTLVYRRVASKWRLAHRHADPLVQGISLEQAAALARGEDGNLS